jgi:hypothetical protein
MKISKLLSIGLFAIFSSTLSFADPLIPDIEVPVNTFQFGTVPEGQVVEHDFIIKNAGQSTLDITKLLPSCGCTASTIANNSITAGAQTTVKVNFNTRGFSGAKVKTVKLFTNDPDEPSVVLSLVGAIQKDITITPQRLEFLKLVHGEDSPNNHASVIVKTREGTSLKLRKVVSISKYVKVIEKELNSFETEVKVAIDPSAPVGELRERVILDLAGAPYKSINLPIYAQIKANVYAEPKTISFGLVSIDNSNLELSRSVKIVNISRQNVRIENINSTNPDLRTELLEVETGKNFVLKVYLDPKKVVKDIKASINLDIVPFNNSIDQLESQKQTITIDVFAIAP